MLHWCDRYITRVEVKGAGMRIRPEVVIVTSTLSIEECFEGAGENYTAAFMRRFPDRRVAGFNA